MPSVLVTGTGGYIGGAIARAAAASGWRVFGGVRMARGLGPGIEPVATGDLADDGFSFPQIDLVIHAAGLGHRRGVERGVWQRQNVGAAVNAAQAARNAGARRFILISTAYVYGRVHEGVVTDSTPPTPMDEYAQSKLDAERAAKAAFGPGFSAIRPCAVIGPGCPGNIPLLIKVLRKGIPLPLGGISNARGFIDVADLAALALTLADGGPETMLGAHPNPISTPDLIKALGKGLEIRPRLFSFPPALLSLAAGAAGRTEMWQSLSGDFITRPDAALSTGWKPAKTLAESFAQTARYFITTAPTP